MYDKELAKEILQQIYHATKLILERFDSMKAEEIKKMICLAMCSSMSYCKYTIVQ